MSIPINIHQSVLQSVISERVQVVQQQHPDMQQRYFDHQLTQERLKKNHKVNEYDEMDATLLRDLRDKEKQKKHEGQQKDKNHEKPALEAQPAVSSPDHPGRIDIKA